MKNIVIVFLSVALLGSIGLLIRGESIDNEKANGVGYDDVNSGVVACTAEAKICPDGSAVGRTGLDCAFAQCPSIVGGVEIYEGISFLGDTKTVDISNRNLSGSLKAEIRHLDKLEILDVSGNNFTGLPAEVGQLSNLQNLNLSDNKFTGLPHELGNLPNLTILDLRDNDISSFDLEIIKNKLGDRVQILW